MKKYQSFLFENFQGLEVKFSIYLNRRVFVISRNEKTTSILSKLADMELWLRNKHFT